MTDHKRAPPGDKSVTDKEGRVFTGGKNAGGQALAGSGEGSWTGSGDAEGGPQSGAETASPVPPLDEDPSFAHGGAAGVQGSLGKHLTPDKTGPGPDEKRSEPGGDQAPAKSPRA